MYLTTILIFTGAAIGFSRHRVLGIGQNTFFEHQYASSPIEAGFFKGLHGGEILNGVLKDLDIAVDESKNLKILLGPRMQWAYAAFQIKSPEGQPVWWHPGTAFPAKDEDGYIKNLLSSRYDAIIFLKGDFTYYSQYYINKLVENYTVDHTYRSLTILRLKNDE